MDNKNVQDFLNSLTEEQRTAVFACKTEEDLEKVVDEYDIDLPDEMLADVAGGKGILPFILAGIMALSGSAGIMALSGGAAITASAAKVYLVEDINGKGKKGDIIEVSDGYAKNYLIPRGMAVLATEEILLEKKSKDEAVSYHQEHERQKANEIAMFLNGKSITLYRKSGENGKFIGTITNKELANAIRSTYGIEIDKRKLNAPDIKSFGSYEVKVNLRTDVNAYMTVNVCQE